MALGHRIVRGCFQVEAASGWPPPARDPKPSHYPPGEGLASAPPAPGRPSPGTPPIPPGPASTARCSSAMTDITSQSFDSRTASSMIRADTSATASSSRTPASVRTLDKHSGTVPKGSGSGLVLVAERPPHPRRPGPTGHPVGPAQLDHRLARLRQPLEVPHQPPGPDQFGERPLHHPPLGERRCPVRTAGTTRRRCDHRPSAFPTDRAPGRSTRRRRSRGWPASAGT